MTSARSRLRRAHCLPLILHAYPFVFDPDQPIGPTSEKMLDDVFADAPTDIGATITTVHHRLSRATTSRFQVLDRFAHEMSVTNAVGHALDALDVFEPWPLRFNIDGHLVEVPNLLVIRPSAFDGGLLAPLLERYRNALRADARPASGLIVSSRSPAGDGKSRSQGCRRQFTGRAQRR